MLQILLLASVVFSAEEEFLVGADPCTGKTNENDSCGAWANIGECSGTHKEYMALKCDLACCKKANPETPPPPPTTGSTVTAAVAASLYCSNKESVEYTNLGVRNECSNSNSDKDNQQTLCATDGQVLQVCPPEVPNCDGYVAFANWGTCTTAAVPATPAAPAVPATPAQVVSADGRYELTQKFTSECEVDGLETITDEATCRAACDALGDKRFNGAGNWPHSPNCFKVVGQSQYKGKCHWNNGAKNPQLINNLNRQVCIASNPCKGKINENDSCGAWANIGECSGTHEEYMASKCDLACCKKANPETPPPTPTTGSTVTAAGYGLTTEYQASCKDEGMTTITDAKTCEAACNSAVIDAKLFRVDWWHHSPNCFKVTDYVDVPGFDWRWVGNCHFNKGGPCKEEARKGQYCNGQDGTYISNRQVCIRTSPAPEVAPPKPNLDESEVARTSKLKRVNKALRTAVEALAN